ncbi:MAG: permease [Spirochaetales bacterium]|nr:permease [Spirochaetales bacterium]
MEFIILSSLTAVLLLISFLKDRKKSMKALKMAGKRLLKIVPMILIMVILIAIILYYFPPDVMSRYLGGENRWLAMLSATVLGTIALIPGFIAFPLGGVLRDSGVPYMVIAAFTSSLMMVGLLTLPVEKQYLGMKVSLLRNLVSFVIALTVAVVTGICYGEIF